MTQQRIRGTRSEYMDFYRIQSRWNDNDVYGHINNVVYYAMFDTAVNGWLVERGLLDPRQSESFGLVVETGCRYYAEMSFPVWITAGIRVAKLGSSSVRYEIGLFSGDDDVAAAEGFFVHVYVDRATRRPVSIDEARRSALQILIRP